MAWHQVKLKRKQDEWPEHVSLMAKYFLEFQRVSLLAKFLEEASRTSLMANVSGEFSLIGKNSPLASFFRKNCKISFFKTAKPSISQHR